MYYLIPYLKLYMYIYKKVSKDHINQYQLGQIKSLLIRVCSPGISTGCFKKMGITEVIIGMLYLTSIVYWLLP